MNIQTLEALLDIDQQAIKDFKAGKISPVGLSEINRNNVDVVKKIISEMGFPTIDKSSPKAYQSAVLVILHSGDVELLQQSITALQGADQDSIRKKDIGYMIDKMRVIQNLPQLYGTQYKIENGGLNFIKIDDLENLEKRRAELEMGSFEEYKRLIQEGLK